jgi:hypothetical protein
MRSFENLLKNHKARKAQVCIEGIQVCSNHGPQESDGATMEKPIFTCVYIGKTFQKSSQ